MKKTLFIILLFFISSVFLFSKVLADECDQISDKREKINCLEQKTRELKQKENSLNSQIQFMDTQINLTSLKIQETEQKIKDTQKEIDILSSRIEGLDISLDYLSRLLINKVVEGYKQREASILDIFLSTENVNILVDRLKYLKITQQNNQKLLVQVQLTKTNFEEQKNLREQKKIELDLLGKQLVVQKNDLNYQKTQKQLLLKDTQNDEVRYQQLLRQALAEFNAIQAAIATGSKVGTVKKGDPIGLVGNSGAPYCSTGPHLHFEVRNNNSWVNPESYLAGKTVQNRQDGGNTSMGSGSWDWPLQDPIIMEQKYGKTPYSWRYSYSGGIHTGIDMWSDSSDVIRAPAEGTLYTSAQNCSGAVINIKYIDHGNGVLTFYLHVQ